MSHDLFSNSLFLRLLTAVAVVMISLLAYRLVNMITLKRLRGRPYNDTGLQTSLQGMPVLLYFTTPTCAPCKTIQRPAISRLAALFGEKLQVVEIDASAQPELASRWGVLSVPTTFILDSAGKPRHVNHGVASTDKLMNQLKDLLTEVSCR